MKIRNLTMAAVAAAAMTWSAAAAAAPGVATGNVNMRTGPGTNYSTITTIPAGAAVEILQCTSWCELVYGGNRGWASANYINAGVAYAPRVVAPARRYAPGPVVVVRDPMPPRHVWRHGRPWWDDRHGAWFDGRYYWHNGRWFDRPPRSGVTFDFRF